MKAIAIIAPWTNRFLQTQRAVQDTALRQGENQVLTTPITSYVASYKSVIKMFIYTGRGA